MISAGEVVRSITSATSASFNERIVIKELLTNACKHHRRTEGELPAVTVEVTIDERTLELRVLNTNADSPREFDFDSINWVGSR